MAEAGSTGAGRERASGPAWAKLTWDDLEAWAGSGAVSRGRSYQQGGRVKNLKILPDGDLLATVQGTERYATTASLGPGRKRPTLESSCTCPVGVACKHAVATVAEYLQAIADGRDVPIADEDDPRWAKLEEGGDDDDEWDEDEESWDEEEFPTPKAPRKSRKAEAPANWDQKIEQHIRSKSHGGLADLAVSLVRRFPEVSREIRERIALQEGDVDQLIAEARRQIAKVTAEPGWQNHWDRDGYTPDYGPIRHRLERLLATGHADEVVSLGRDLIRKGLRQVGESNDEGETAMAFSQCAAVVFQAVMQSSLAGPERLLFAIDAELADDYEAIGEASDAVLHADHKPEDWSAVADALLKRLEALPEDKGEGDFSRKYKRNVVANWTTRALKAAGRDRELLAIYESEARATGSYDRLVQYLLAARRPEDAERWAREGIAAVSDKYPGTGEGLAAHLGQLAADRKRWDVVAAHAARPFFKHPAVAAFHEMLKAAKKAGVEDAVRDAALRFLETGVIPYRVISPSTPAAEPPARARSTSKGKPAPIKAAPAPKAKPRDRIKIDPSWPLPVPDYLIPLMKTPPGQYDPGPRPHPEILLEMAIAAKEPDRVLHWYDRMNTNQQNAGYHYEAASYANRVAEAVAATHPERTIEIYLKALNAQLPHAQQSSYESSAGYLKKLRPVYQSLGRLGEWDTLVASIREKYKNRPKFMEQLDRLDGQTIVQWTRRKRK